MTRSRRSARQAGSSFERSIANYLMEATDNDAIDRMVKRGSADCGDIANLKFRGHRIAIEAKDCARMDLPTWTREAVEEADNYNALAGFVVAKRRGVTDPGKQWLIGTVDQLVSLIMEVPQR